jgi:hypothetical protein
MAEIELSPANSLLCGVTGRRRSSLSAGDFPGAIFGVRSFGTAATGVTMAAGGTCRFRTPSTVGIVVFAAFQSMERSGGFSTMSGVNLPARMIILIWASRRSDTSSERSTSAVSASIKGLSTALALSIFSM